MLDVKDVSSIRINRAVNNREIYKNILAKTYDKILWAANWGQTNCVYYIRPLQPGRPLINTQNAANYVVHKLKKGGFHIETTFAAGTVMLVISWNVSRSTLLSQLADKCVTKDESIF